MRFALLFTLASCMIQSACKTSRFASEVTQTTDAPPKIEIPATPPPRISPPQPAEPRAPQSIDSTVVTSTSSSLQLQQSCDRPVQLLSTQIKLNFPKRQKCSFNIEPNKAPLEGYIQAREISRADMTLPANSEICSVQLESPANAVLKYDDFIVLTWENFILFASNKEMVSKLQKVDGLYVWDFLKVRESKIANFKETAYCISAADRCQFPGTDMAGPVLLKLNFTELAGLTKNLQGKTTAEMQLIATGDNDDSAEKMDCYHEALDLTLTLNYIKKNK